MPQPDRKFLHALRRELVARIEAHHPSRRGHADRVSVYAVATGFELGIREDEDLLLLQFLSAVHEHWKLQVKTEILEKPGPLSQEEKPDVFRLCELSAKEIQAQIQHPRAKALRYLYLWHKAYPPLPDEETPERNEENLARITAQCIYVSTVYDVLVNDQPWRKSLSEESATEEIQKASGTQFHPDVVSAFLRVQPLIQPLKNV